jgi:hypothetical protein
MTISSTTVKNSYSGDSSTTTFSYTFKIFQDSDIQVIIRSSTGTETTKTITTHYTVTGAGNSGGGSVIFTGGNIPTTGQTVVLRRNIPQTQAIDYIANDPFPAESHEEGLDRATMSIQQLQEEVTRSIKLSRTNTMTSTEFTVAAADRANKILAFDSTGEIAVTQELGTYRGNWATATSYYVRDLIKDTSNNNIYICNTAHTSTGSQPISSNADVAKWSLIVDAATATTSATAAAASASAASTSASNASTSASAASTSASNASTSASNASTSASNASTSASNASTSATNAAASYDSFDDRYLGAKSSDPALDNDSNALVDGALYFDTTNNVMKVYDLGNTIWKRTTPTSAEQTNIDTVSGISSNVTSVANISSNVTAVAGNATNINTVAGANANITTVAGANTNIGTVATNITNVNSVAGGVIPTRVSVIADGTSISINADTADFFTQANTQAVGTLTVNAPTGTLVNAQRLILRIRSTNVQTFSWNAIFEDSDELFLPTATSGSTKYDYFGFFYNSAANKWQLVSKLLGF